MKSPAGNDCWIYWCTKAKAVFGAISIASLVVAPLVIVPSSGASASGPADAFVVTGALTGTLKIGSVTQCDGNVNGGDLSSFSTSLSSKKYSNWSMTFSQTKPGAAAKKFNRMTATFVLQSGQNAWVATGGTMTFSSGVNTVNLTLGAHEGSASGTVHIKGKWSCAG